MSLRKKMKKALTDEEFFTSSEVNEYSANLVTRLTKQTIPVLCQWGKEEDSIAGTTGKTVFVNANNYFAKGMNRKDRFFVFVALLLHEIGHILYTDFKLEEKCRKHVQEEGKFYPTPSIPYDDSVIDKIGRKNCIMLLHSIWNSIEDGHIEARLMNEHRSYKPEMATMRWSQFESTETFEEDKDKGLNKFSLLANRILTFAEFADAKVENPEDELFVNYVKPVMPFIEKAVCEKNSYLRGTYCNNVFVKIMDVIEEQEQKKQEQGKSGSENQNEQQEQSSESENGSQEQQQQSDGTNSQSGNLESQAQENGSDTLENAVSQMVSEMRQPANFSDTATSSPLIENNGQTQCLPVEESSSNDAGTKDFQRLVKEVEKTLEKNEIESDIKNEIAQFPTTIDFGHMHERIECGVIREKDTSANRYNELEKEISPMVRKMVSELKKEIKQRQQGDKLSGIYNGRRIEGRNLYRTDKKITSKNILPENVPNMRVCMCIDNSGSMQGLSIKQAKKMSLAVYLACKQLAIPVAVYGHTDELDGTVNIISYAEFDSADDKDKFRICNMGTYSCNRDGYALKFCEERLAKYNEEVKLLFVISDGTPHGSFGYGKNAGKEDIQTVLKDCKKKNVVVITSGLGSDKDDIESIWINGSKNCKFLDLSDEAMLPKKLVRIITGYLG